MMWQPVSGCGPDCVDSHATTSRGRAALRIGAMAGVLLGGLLLVPLLRGAAVQAVARTLLAVLGIELVWRGRAPKPGSLLVANHVSWLDIVALMAVEPVRLVAKHDVRSWPAIGTLAKLSGSVFVDRTRPRLLPATVAEVGAVLKAGRSVAVFPEGTTSCGASTGRFRPAMFQAAVAAQAPIVPITIRYDSSAAAFVGDDTLFSSVRRVASRRRLTVTLVAAAPLHPAEGADRRVLARAAQASMGTGGQFGLAA